MKNQVIYLYQKLGNLKNNFLLLDFDANGLYPTAMSDKQSVYLKIETGYAFTKDMIDDFVNALRKKFGKKQCCTKNKIFQS